MKVMPTCFWIWRSSVRMCWRSLRSSAESGSSSSSTAGSTASARATATRWRWPPDSSVGFLWPWPVSATSSSSSSARRRRSLLRHAAALEAEGDVLPHRHQREQREVLEDQRGRPPVRPDARSSARRRSRIVPVDGSRKPEIIRRIVVLPQPEGPRIEKNSPALIDEIGRAARRRSRRTASTRLASSTSLPRMAPARCSPCAGAAEAAAGRLAARRPSPTIRRW